MNQPERDELRAKHHVGQNEAEDQCQACYSADGYPCDVIKVLDAWEEASKQLVEYIDKRSVSSRTQIAVVRCILSEVVCEPTAEYPHRGPK